MAFLDHFISQESRWEWDYASGTGYQLCPINDATLGDTICELGITDATSDAAYSDGNIRETSQTIGTAADVSFRLKYDTMVIGSSGLGMWNGNQLYAEATWFQWCSDASDAALRGMRAYVLDGGVPLYISDAITGYDWTEYHTFRVDRNADSAYFYIDGDLVASYEDTMPSDDNFRVEVWRDNAYFVSGARYYEESTVYRRLYVDWLVLDTAEPSEALGTGQVYPTAASSTSESPWSDNDWTSPTNIYSDNGSSAYIDAASYDDPDQTYVLRGYTFDFSDIPAGATILGIVARINCWYANGTCSLDLCQLLDASGARVGTNLAATPIALTTTNTTIITLGAYNNKWGNELTRAWVQDEDFGIALGFLATGANTDVFVDYVSLEIYYEEGAGSTYEMAATLTAASNTPTNNVLAVARSMASALTGVSATPETGVLAISRSVSAVLTGASATPDDIGMIAAMAMAASLTAASATPDDIGLIVARLFSAAVNSATATPDNPDLSLSLLFSAALTAASSTPDDIAITNLVSLLATLTADTATSSASINVARSMAAILTAASNTSDDPGLAVLRTLAAVLTGASATLDSGVLAVSRSFAAILTAASATPDNITITNLLSLAATLTAQTATPDDGVLSAARAFAAVLTATSNTPDALVLAILRALSAALTGASATPDDVTLDIAGIVTLAAVLTAASTTPDIALNILRSSASVMTANSATPDDGALAVLRAMAAALSGASATPDSLILSVSRNLSSQISAVSATPNDAIIAIARSMVSTITGATTTPDDVAMLTAIKLAAILTAVSATPDDISFAYEIVIGAYGTVFRPNRVSVVYRPDRTGEVERPNRVGLVKSDRQGD